MFRKVQLRLTLFADGIITFILLIMTFSYLTVSEKNIVETRLLSYQNDIYTIASNLSQQSVISHNWLKQLEGSNHYYLSIMDNGVPFLFNNLGNTHQDELSQSWKYYHENKDSLETSVLSYQCCYYRFYFTDASKEDYFAFVIHAGEGASSLEMLLLSPLYPIQHQIRQQRIIFLGIVAAALILLCSLSWFFIGRMLIPIEESRKQQNRFIAAASHELRTPLAVILSCVEEMKEDNSSSPFAQTLSVLHEESIRMSSLLSDMLTLSSNTELLFSIEKSPVEFDTLLLNTSETFESMAKSRNIKLSVVLPDSALPLFHCDKGRIQQLLSILVHNAISYTPKGGNIQLSLSMQKDAFILQVADTGAGIPDEEKDKIFDCFYRSESARSSKGHFGLGLSIASQITQAHHGKISVSDNEGGGTVFTVKLPINK